MKTVSLKLKQKNDFQWQIKNGAKVLQDISKITSGWHASCKTFSTLESAVEYARNSIEESYCAFGSDVKVELC